MRSEIFILLVLISLAGCKFSRSEKKDLDSGILTTGKNITCEDIYLTANNEIITRNSFTYGETFYINFEDVKGFATVNGKVFPGMVMAAVIQGGDTIWKSGNLYSGNTGGLNYSPLKLTADFTVAAPVRSGKDYTLIIKLWDTKGEGTFNTKFNFKVVSNELIKVESSGVIFDEVYLFSQGGNKVITNNKIGQNDNIYIIVEGLKGFREEYGEAYPGIRIKVFDAANNIMVNSEDMFARYDETGVSAADLTARVSAHFSSIPVEGFVNPLHCEIFIWDKKSNARMNINTDLTLE